MDLELCQIHPLYYYYLKNYYVVLKQRNNLLKTLKKDPSQMDQVEVWDLQLCTYGCKIIEFREKFVEDLNVFFKKNHYYISGEKEVIDLNYHQNCSIPEFEGKLKKHLNYDIMLGSTSVGPHKDDLGFTMNGLDIRKYGSQGQQRTAALSLKLSEIELLKTITDEKPVLLLDDVLSELDRFRQSYLMNCIHDIQTIMTCTGVEDFIKTECKIGKMFQVKDGKVIEETIL